MVIADVVRLKTPSRAGSLPHWISGVHKICDHWSPPPCGSELARDGGL